MGGKQNVKMQLALVKHFFNIPRAVQDSVPKPKKRLLHYCYQPNEFSKYFLDVNVLFYIPFWGLGLTRKDVTNAQKHYEVIVFY